MTGDVHLVIADSLRWDFADHLEGIFEDRYDRETWSRVVTPETFTAPCVSTILTGVDPEDHGVKDWNAGSLSFEDNLVQKYDATMFSPVFGDHDKKRIIEIPKTTTIGLPKYSRTERPEQRVKDFLDTTSLDEFIDDTGTDLVIYHSFITHAPWGTGGTEDATMIEFSNNPEYYTHERYRRGPEDFVSWMRKLLEESFDDDDVIIIVGDHGEGLPRDDDIDYIGHMERIREEGEVVDYESVTKTPESTHVPLIVNRDLDLPEKIDLKDVRAIVESLLKDRGKINWDPDIDMTETTQDGITDEVRDRLEDMGYM